MAESFFSNQLLSFQENLFDLRYGIDTQGKIAQRDLRVDSPNLAHAKIYQPTRIRTFRRLLHHLEPELFEGMFLDFGCGKGRVLALAHQAGFRQLGGVEFSPHLAQIAERNLQHIGVSDFTIFQQDATEMEIPASTTLFYFFNPFGAPVMQKVLTKISLSVQQNPRLAYLVYVVPTLRDLIDQRRFELLHKLDLQQVQPVFIYRVRPLPVRTFREHLEEKTESANDRQKQ